MSAFSWVDGAPDPDLLLSYLDQTARAGSRMKHYVMAAHALRRPDGPILDLGCGAGHDLALLASAGLEPVGVDPSATLLRTAAQRTAASVLLVQATGEMLPFREGSFAGCRIERVLLHVLDPRGVLTEAVRCLDTGALLTVYEPDFDSLIVRNNRGEDPVPWLARARHPGVGGVLWNLIEDAGCDVLDRVEELSVWRSLAVLDRVVGIDASVVRAIDAGRVGQEEADRWVAEQRTREANGEFYATMPKVLIVARKL